VPTVPDAAAHRPPDRRGARGHHRDDVRRDRSITASRPLLTFAAIRGDHLRRDQQSDGRLEVAELLGVLRDPIEWVFTLAERRAQGDPVDIAAIHRVRDAVLHRVNDAIVGRPRVESPRIRSADLWTVGGLLIDALDPGVVERVLRGVGSSIADVLVAGLPFDPSLVAHLGRAAAPFTGPDVPPSAAQSWYLGAIPPRAVAQFGYGAALPHLTGLCGGSCLGLCPSSLAAAHALRSTVPPWCWSQSPVAF
jgi:hypothetical protein